MPVRRRAGSDAPQPPRASSRSARPVPRWQPLSLQPQRHPPPRVAQAAAGISAQWLASRHGIGLAVMQVWRTREFDEQAGIHAFGSVALNVEF
ncbi:MAG TPA: DUF2219 family protein [Chiayiivirga sp.]|nr:DUF2219 family protein [Chiayiivirga sp.]